MKLKDLKAQTPKPPDMRTDEGKAWYDRTQKANKRHDDQMMDVPILASLYAKPYTTINTKDGVVIVKIPWAKAFLDNFIADVYFRNPDLFVEPRVSSDIERMVARECRDLAKTLDDDLRTPDNMYRALLGWGISGFGGIWECHEQQHHYEQTGEQATDEETGEPMVDDETGEAVPAKEMVVDEQRLKEEFVEACDYRFDPDGTDWIGLSDFKWIARIYTRSLADMIEDEEYDSPDARARLIWYAAGFGRTRDGSSASLDMAAKDEDDIRYINIRCAEIWSMAEGQIIHVPLGSQFDLTKYPWPRALLAGKPLYPTRLVSDGFTIRTRDDENPYPTPLLRHIRALIEDYVRIYDRLLNAGGGIVKRHFTYKGVFDRTTFKKWANSDETEMLEIDPENVRKLLGMEDGGAPNLFDYLEKIMRLQPSQDTKNEIIAYGAMLDRIERILWQATGQGPADRGGIAPSETATGVAAMAAKLDSRTAMARERVVSSAYRDLHEIKFRMIAENQTLPMSYRSAGPDGETAWQQFQADVIRGVPLAFRTAVGSSKPPTREQQKTERMELFSKIAPFFEQIRTDPFALAMTLFVVEPHDASIVEEMLRQLGTLPPVAQEFMQLMMAIKRGVNPDGSPFDPTSPQGLASSAKAYELGTKMSQGILGPAGMQQLAAAPDPLGQAPANPGNVAGVMSQGQRRAASAAAGAPA